MYLLQKKKKEKEKVFIDKDSLWVFGYFIGYFSLKAVIILDSAKHLFSDSKNWKVDLEGLFTKVAWLQFLHFSWWGKKKENWLG